MPNLHSIIPVDIVIGIHNNTIRKQELEELRENFIYSQSLYDRIRDVIDSEQVALLLLFTYRITWEEFQELLQDHHKNDPDTKRDFFAAVEEVLGEFKANGKVKLVCLPLFIWLFVFF